MPAGACVPPCQHGHSTQRTSAACIAQRCALLFHPSVKVSRDHCIVLPFYSNHCHDDISCWTSTLDPNVPHKHVFPGMGIIIA